VTDLAFWRTLHAIEPWRVGSLLVESPAIRAEVRQALTLLDRELTDRMHGAIGFDDGSERRVIDHLAFAMRRPATALISGKLQPCYAGSWETRSIQAARLRRSSVEHELRRLWQRATFVPTDRVASRSIGVVSWLAQFSLEALAREWRPVAIEGRVGITLVDDPAGSQVSLAQRTLIRLLNSFVNTTLRRSKVRRELAVDGLANEDVSPYWGFYATRRSTGDGCATRSHFLGLSSLTTHINSDLRDFTKRVARERSIAPPVHADLDQIEDRRRGAEPTAMIIRELLSPDVRWLLRRGRSDQAEALIRSRLLGAIDDLQGRTRTECRTALDRSWFSTVVVAARQGRGLLQWLREFIGGLEPVERRHLDREVLLLLGRPHSIDPRTDSGT